MRHLYSSRVEVLRLSRELVDGTSKYTWGRVQSILDSELGLPGEMMCRFDLQFVRPGKDQPMPVEAGRAVDRTGVMYFDVTEHVKAGDRVRHISGPYTGTFEIRNTPDAAPDFSGAHHMEVQVVEVAQAEIMKQFPGSGLER